MSEFLTHFKDIVGKYDRFIFDQWGVLHNGHYPLGESVQVLEYLKQQNKQVILLSNSSKLADHNNTMNRRIGIDNNLYCDVITSGEAVNRALNNGHIMQKEKPTIYFIAWDDNRGMVRGFDHIETDDVNIADMIICAGTIYEDINDYYPDLNKALAKELPMIVANPDLWSMRPDGSLAMCPGYVAKTYEDMGGEVQWFGKPLPIMYQFCADVLGGLDNCLAIGDSLHHDIKGANDAGIDSLLIANGVHRFDLKCDQDIKRIISNEDVQPLYEKYDAEAQYVMIMLNL